MCFTCLKPKQFTFPSCLFIYINACFTFICLYLCLIDIYLFILKLGLYLFIYTHYNFTSMLLTLSILCQLLLCCLKKML